jgi:hypothetical protein
MMEAKGVATTEAAAATNPLVKYNPRKPEPPNRISRRGPKKNNMSMLRKMCPNPPCKNMYVISVHGSRGSAMGRRTNFPRSSGGRASLRKNITTFAMMIRFTQGVILSIRLRRGGDQFL